MPGRRLSGSLVSVSKQGEELITITAKIAAAVAVASGGLFAGAATADARPCEKHPAKAEKGETSRAACLRQYRRDRMAWPPNPKAWEIKRRVGAYNWAKAHRVANCETGGTRGATRYRGNLDWHLTGKFQGPLGMFRTTALYGKRKTGYTAVRLSWPEWVAVAVAAHPITGGWNGWGCRGA